MKDCSKQTCGRSKVRKAKVANVVVALAMVAMLALQALPLPAYAAPAQAWYSSSWAYRRTITLSSSTTVASYQVLVTLTTAVMGSPYSHVNSDGSDIRFTGSDKTTLQDYWIESWDNTGTSKIWVEVATSGTSTIYMYYGNAGAAAASSGDNTFLFFDDFAGSSIDAAKWALHASGGTFFVTVSGGVLHQYATAGYHILRSIASPELTNNTIIEHKMKIGTYADGTNQTRNRFFITGADSGKDNGTFDNFANSTIQYYWGAYTGTATTLDTWLRNVFKIHGSTLDWAVSIYSTGTSEYSNSTAVTVTTPVKYYPWIGDYGSTSFGGDLYTDWVLVRAYASTEPSTTAGVEQVYAWESYGDTGYGTPDDDFTGQTTVYLHGTGFQDVSHLVAYYDNSGDKRGSETVSASSGILNSTYVTTSAPTAAGGTSWHALVQPSSGYTGFGTASYATIVAAPDTYGLLANDAFSVPQSAIPELPTVLAGVIVAGLSFGIYYWMRRRLHGTLVGA